MNNDAINQKRNRLERGYKLNSEYNRLHCGYMNDDDFPSKFQYFYKLLEYQFLSHYFGGPPKWRMLLRKINRKRTLPDFCVIGPMKSGTSDLAVNIMMHPNVIPPLAKEIGLADPEYWRIFYPTERQKKEHIFRYGLALSPFLAPDFHWMELTYKLSLMKPNIKVVLTLREPVKRFYSHWKWDVLLSGKKRANELPFLTSFPAYVDKALEVFPEYPMYTRSGYGPDPLQTSIYWKAVSYWIECFGRNNVLVLDVADYFFDRNIFLNKIYEFVGLPRFECLTSNNIVNENTIILPAADEESVLKLKAFFKPYNEKLWTVLGKEFDWN